MVNEVLSQSTNPSAVQSVETTIISSLRLSSSSNESDIIAAVKSFYCDNPAACTVTLNPTGNRRRRLQGVTDSDEDPPPPAAPAPVYLVEIIDPLVNGSSRIAPPPEQSQLLSAALNSEVN